MHIHSHAKQPAQENTEAFSAVDHMAAIRTEDIDFTLVDDGELLHRVSLRDQEAFAALYDRYATVLYSLCLAIVKKQEEAEDVLQECFLQMWEKASAFNSAKGSAYTWLATLTRHRAIDRLRSKHFRKDRQKQPDVDFDRMADPSALTPLENTSIAERAGIVKKAFATLPPVQQKVVEMAYFQGYTQSEIAGKLQVPLGTVKTRIREAVKKLQRILQGQI